jgi:deoxyribodipyrimidine photo-lyase
VDGDPAANNGNWQWTAGVGLDAAPYFRVLNPVLQGKRYDPAGAWVRRWLPELSGMPDRWVHEPWKIREVGGKGGDYPLPIVDHGEARQRALTAYAGAAEDYRRSGNRG